MRRKQLTVRQQREIKAALVQNADRLVALSFGKHGSSDSEELYLSKRQAELRYQLNKDRYVAR